MASNKDTPPEPNNKDLQNSPQDNEIPVIKFQNRDKAHPIEFKNKERPVPLPLGSWQSVCICNETHLTLVYVISNLSPLFWGVLHPGEFVERTTGPFYFQLKTYPYSGANLPRQRAAVIAGLDTAAQVLVGTLMLGTVVAAGVTTPLGVGVVAVGSGILTRKVSRRAVWEKKWVRANRKRGSFNEVKMWVRGNGKWVYVRGGPEVVEERGVAKIVPGSGRPMFFSRFPSDFYDPAEVVKERAKKVVKGGHAMAQCTEGRCC
ncbi:hypothetical protein DFH27DRAFT_610154 [Peziza echinospora]|nr:hypothetical protein DFH27DRAFT_610154 [Peziza echinospora]